MRRFASVRQYVQNSVLQTCLKSLEPYRTSGEFFSTDFRSSESTRWRRDAIGAVSFENNVLRALHIRVLLKTSKTAFINTQNGR